MLLSFTKKVHFVLPGASFHGFTKRSDRNWDIINAQI